MRVSEARDAARLLRGRRPLVQHPALLVRVRVGVRVRFMVWVRVRARFRVRV